MAWRLAVSAAAAWLAAALFARIGLAVARRATATGADRAATRWFATWWLAFALSTLAVGGMALAGIADPPSLALVVGLRVASLAFLSVALWGLLSHLVYVRTGRDRSRAIAWGYGALGAGAIAHLLWTRPLSVDITGWTTDFVVGRGNVALSTGLFVLAFLLPPLLAGVAYWRIGARLDDPAQRRRVRTLGGGIALWIFAHLAARIAEDDVWQLLTRTVLGTAVALAIWRELRPRSLTPPTAREDAFRQRVRDLV